jgi:hypothetical protein
VTFAGVPFTQTEHISRTDKAGDYRIRPGPRQRFVNVVNVGSGSVSFRDAVSENPTNQNGLFQLDALNLDVAMTRGSKLLV